VARRWKKTNVIVMCGEEKERRVLQVQNLVGMKNVEVTRAAGVGERGLHPVANLHEGVGEVSEPVVA
jgi:hypothetical protein